MPKDESEIGEKLPELFDIHVMFFADTSNEAITALQRAFSLERSVAEKLIADAPVMVKRAASPEVADSLLDVLNNLGAQVVLLPSTAGASVVPDDAAGNLLSGGGPIWGGLEPKPKPAPVPVAAEVDEATEDSDRLAPDLAAAPPQLQQLEPTPRANPAQLRPRLSTRPVAEGRGGAEQQGLELDLDEIPQPPAAGRAPSVRDSEVDLGLGSVPPLPSASAARPATPPRVPPARPVAAPAPPPRLAKSTPVEVDETGDKNAVLPDLQLAVPDSGEAFWSAKRKPAGKGKGGDVPASQTRSHPARSSIPAEAPRSRTFALSALLGGVMLFAVSGYFDQSIFSGNANPLWVVVQAFGFLGVGTGCARIRR
jgi:hypothetical protein